MAGIDHGLLLKVLYPGPQRCHGHDWAERISHNKERELELGIKLKDRI